MNQTMEKSIVDIIQSLKENPMFHLSLGSKELFHSNFLEFLWEEDKVSFFKMLCEILGDGNEQIKQMINSQEEYILSREKKKFDICIYHKDDETEIYDVIIENKVKSIPYKTQLDGYVKAIGNNHRQTSPVYILLSLAKAFPDKNVIEKEDKWKIVSYDSLLEAIQNYYFNKELCNSYIKDYCAFISRLYSLQECIMDKIMSTTFYDATIISKFEDVRLHDLYHKLRGSYFISELFNMLNRGNLNNTQIKIEKGDRKGKDGTIFLSSTMNNGKSTITASILKDKTFYEIQIEGEQYRHMFNQPNLAKVCSILQPQKKQSKVDKSILTETLTSNSHAFQFINFSDNFDVKNINEKVSGNYCKYAPDCVYRYKLYDNNLTFQEVLRIMADDVTNIYDILFSPKAKTTK